MADADLLMVYRSIVTADLQAMKAKFLAEMGGYSSQSVGQKSFTRDLRYLRDQLAAIQFVLNERSGDYVGTIVTDFSVLGRRGFPSGTTELL